MFNIYGVFAKGWNEVAFYIKRLFFNILNIYLIVTIYWAI